MLGLNRAFFIGHVGRDPEVRVSASGVTVANVNLAVPNRRKNAEGEWVDTPDWIRLTMFNKDAEFAGKYIRKGTTLSVECSVRPRKWQDKEGVVHYETSFVVERLLSAQGARDAATTEAPASEASSEVTDAELSEIPAQLELSFVGMR